MFDSNVTVVGTVDRPPVSRSRASGPVAEFRLVADVPATRRPPRPGRRALEITVVARRSLAEAVRCSIDAGDEVIVRGRLFSRYVGGLARHEITASSIGRSLLPHVDPSLRADPTEPVPV